MLNKKSRIQIKVNESFIKWSDNKSITNTPIQHFLLNNKLHIHLLSKKPFTNEGIRFFIQNNSSPDNNFIISCCSDHCDNLIDAISCRFCSLASIMKNFEYHPINAKIFLNILIIDDYTLNDFIPIKNTKKNEDEIHILLNSSLEFINKEIGKNIIKIILLTESKNVLYLKHQINSGINGLLHITSAPQNVLTAIETVKKGNFYIDAQINSLISEYQDYLGSNYISKLSHRQLEIIYEVSNNLKNRQIAPRLNISVDAVEKHKTNIKNILKLHIDELNEFAVENKQEIQFLLEFPIKRPSK